MRVTVGPQFERALKSLPPSRGKAAIAALRKFAETPELPSLDFRPLAGAPGHFIINPHRGDRIILRKVADDHYEAVDIGPHDNIYRRWQRRR